jgi:dihydrodipicolinate synthase/N-acetylneuraminate lyase
MDILRCLDVDPDRYEILFGCDEALLTGLSLGASGAVGSTYNFMAPLYLKLIQAFEQGRLGKVPVNFRRNPFELSINWQAISFFLPQKH